jgi:RND family efflux transporter MFP subunit
MKVSQLLHFGQAGRLLMLVLFISSCGKNGEKTMPTEQHITESVYASGVIKALDQYDVFAPANGILAETFVKAGDSLLPGTPLFRIDNTISTLSSDNARLAMEIMKDKSGSESGTLLDAESRMNLAEEKMKSDSILLVRQKLLWDQNVGTLIELEKRELTYKSSRTEFVSARLLYNQLKSELEKSYRQAINNLKISEKQRTDFTVKSKMEGTVFNILKESGEFVSTLTPVAIIGKSNQFEIELQVDEFDIVKIKPGQKVYMSMDSYRGQVFESIVSKIEPYMNERTRTFKVWASFVKQPERLYPNLSVEANILVAEKQNVLTVPSGYLIGKNKVLTAPEETTMVEVGISNMQWVEITSGLEKNQQIYLPVQ